MLQFGVTMHFKHNHYSEDNVPYSGDDTITDESTIRVIISDKCGFINQDRQTYHLQVLNQDKRVLDYKSIEDSIKEFRRFYFDEASNYFQTGDTNAWFVLPDIDLITMHHFKHDDFHLLFNLNELSRCYYPERWDDYGTERYYL